VLAAALAHASWNALLKGKRGHPLAASAGLSLTWLAIGTPLMFFVEPPGAEAYPHLAVSVAVHCVYFWLLVKAYELADLSLVYPIARGLPPLIVALATWVVVSEVPSRAALLGIGLVAFGVLALGLLRGRAVDADGSEGRNKALALALATALFIATYTVIDGLGVRASGSPLGYAVWLTSIQGGVFALAAMGLGGAALRREVWRSRRSAALAGVLSAGGYTVALWAMSLAPIAAVAALRETSVVFAVLIGVVFLDEPLGRGRVAAACLVAAGVIAIKMGG